MGVEPIRVLHRYLKPACLPIPPYPHNKKVAFGDYTFSGRLSCYSVLSSLQVSDDISFIIKNTVELIKRKYFLLLVMHLPVNKKVPSAIILSKVDFLVIPFYRPYKSLTILLT